MSGPEIAAEVAAAVAEATAEIGNGSALTVTITRPGTPDESTYPPTLGTPTTYTAGAMVGSYSAMDRDGTNITAEDVKITVTVPLADEAGNTTSPQNGDTLALSDGRVFHVENVEALRPGETVLMWKVQARRGG